MGYPMEAPVAKHDVKFIHEMPSPETSMASASEWIFTKTSQLFQTLQSPAAAKPPMRLASVYSYKDAPDHPGPLSRDLVILGVADASLSLVRKLDQDLPDCLHRCTIAVKLADPKHMAKLPASHQQNSKAFGRFMQRLRKDECVAVVAKDKHGRFGMIRPLKTQKQPSGRELLPEDCAAECFVGDVDDVIAYLSGGTLAEAATSEAANDAVTGTFTPSTPPFAPPPDDDDDDDQPVYRPGDGGGSFSNDHDHDNNHANGSHNENGFAQSDAASSGIWKPPMDDGGEEWKPPETNDDSNDGMWKPPGAGDDDGDFGDNGTSAPWAAAETESAPSAWAAPVDNATSGASNKRSFDDMNNGGNDNDDGDDMNNGGNDNEDTFHSNKGAAAADEFYSNLKRNKGTRSDSWIYHMRAFNGWVKAMQIQELDPRIVKNGKPQGKTELRVLDLACGKGGDLLKWAKHKRGMKHYVGIDVARGSLRDAAIRSREMRLKNQLNQAIFTCADLGDDVPGRKKSPSHKRMQKLLTWSLDDEGPYESGTPEFKPVRGGGVSESDRFDVVSIQFAIHYMMSTGKRARRFLHTVSQLLEIGGNLICTTIDARVVMSHLLGLGINYKYDDASNDEDEQNNMPSAEIPVGSGSCVLRFDPSIVKRIFTAKSDGSKGDEELFGLQYTFILKDGDNNEAGVGEAVDLPEWLTPLPVLESIAKEAGLELDYAQNFHEFWQKRKDPSEYSDAHGALQNMRVLNRNGTISEDEWSVSRLYVAISFRKVRESEIEISPEPEDEDDDADADDDDNIDQSGDNGKKNAEINGREDEQPSGPEVKLDPIKAKKMFPMAMMKAKKLAGDEKWNSLSSADKKQLTQIQLEKMAAA